MPAAAQHYDRAPRGDDPLGDQLATAAEAGNHPVDERIVGGAIDLGDRGSVLDRGEHPDLPVGDMTGKDDHAAARSNCPVHMLKAVRLDPPARVEDPDFS